jgi:diguanylate cyclase (GGDEF)-like protein/PAS domain S-box-containing protein
MNVDSPRPNDEFLSHDENNPFIYQFAVEAARLGIWLYNVVADDLFISSALARIVGLPDKPAQLSIKKWQSFILPEDRQLIDEAIKAAIQTGELINLEYRLRDCDGNILWLSATGSVYRNTTGSAVQAAGVVVDITAKKRIEAALRHSEERYRQLAEMSPDGILVDCHGRYVYANQAAARILGARSPNDIVGRRPLDFVDKSHQHVIAEHTTRMLEDDKKVSPVTIPYRQLSGASVDIQVTMGRVAWENEPAIQVMLRDITEMKQVQDQLQVTSERLHIALEGAGESIWDWDIVNNIYSFSSAIRKLLAIPLDAPIPECGSFDEFIHPEDVARVHNAIDAYLSGDVPGYKCEFRIKARDATWRWVLSRGTVVSRDAAGKPLIMTGTMSDITATKEAEEAVWRHANLDALTGIANRRLFRERLEMEMCKAQRHGLQVALLYMDLDRFKEVNDLYGHNAGDMVLTHVVLRMQQCVRQTDTIARLGGDEFVIMLTDLDQSSHVEFTCEKLLASLSKPFQVKKDHAYVTASIGVAIFPIDAMNSEDLIRRADQAMFAAKRNGKNQFSYFKQSMDESAHRRLRISNELHQALEAGQMSVHYQPIVDLVDGRIVKAEALLRWQHPSLGAIAPSVFIPYAEESGLIGRLGDWVFEQAVKASQCWSACTGNIFQISINKSPLQFMNRTPETDSLRHLGTMHLAGSHVAVELTEGILLHALPNVTSRLQEYRDAGVQIAIDDFGTGYSSMAYLQKFHIDYLKIDQSFIRDIGCNPAHKTITETMILMAHKLGLKAIAEGIETQEQLDLLKKMGCDYGQGFLFSPALPPEQFENLLTRRTA